MQNAPDDAAHLQVLVHPSRVTRQIGDVAQGVVHDGFDSLASTRGWVPGIRPRPVAPSTAQQHGGDGHPCIVAGFPEIGDDAVIGLRVLEARDDIGVRDELQVAVPGVHDDMARLGWAVCGNGGILAGPSGHRRAAPVDSRRDRRVGGRAAQVLARGVTSSRSIPMPFGWMSTLMRPIVSTS
ncbi:hypothetical protein AC792_12155 [Arthrobacter sp. RIT-PI-e]|nr:hypothetical protein AC792_12155 [Arthrobacter sp. RIT-PI-e]